jgi:molecular chaperone GrpE
MSSSVWSSCRTGTPSDSPLVLLRAVTILGEASKDQGIATLRRPGAAAEGLGMSDTKGPQVELPPELQEELETGYAEGAQPGAEGSTDEAAGLRQQFDELNDKYLRLAAEYDNFRRRSLRERQDALKYGNENLVKELLATLDNLDRALGHAREEGLREEGSQLLAGVELTFRSLLQTLEKFGVKEVAALGSAFDPSVHQAIRQVPSDAHPPGTVAEVLQKGYMLADRLLRPALVGVSSGATEKPDEPS